MLNELTEIDYWYEGEKIAITNAEDMESFFEKFASLQLTPKTVDKDDELEGHFQVDFVTSSSTIEFGLLTVELIVDPERYSVDKDITQEVQEIALNSKDK